MRSFSLMALFFVGAPLLLFYGLQMTSLPRSVDMNVVKFLSPEKGVSEARVFASLPELTGTVGYDIESADAREMILRDYLRKQNSDLLDMEGVLVEAADEYDLDFRLLVAIARQESNLCKYIPEGGYNCWGWGIHKRGTLGFESYDDAIWTVSKGLRERYLDDGLITPEEIMSRYTPSSNGSWAFAVNQFFTEME